MYFLLLHLHPTPLTHHLHHRNAIESQEDEVRRLRAEVEEKERALTDCRLEALSAQHQMQAQADTIARLQVGCQD